MKIISDGNIPFTNNSKTIRVKIITQFCFIIDNRQIINLRIFTATFHHVYNFLAIYYFFSIPKPTF